MPGIHKIIVIMFCITSFSALSVQSQSAQGPFENTWYGFNTQTGSQNYFLTYAKLADLDNDGDSDVVASKYFAGFSGSATGFVTLFNQGNGFLNSVPVHYTSTHTSKYVELAYVNNDGFKDVIAANTGANGEGNSVSVYLNQGGGIFGNPSNYNVGAGPTGIAVSDFNNDGNIDLAVSNYGYLGQGNSISVLINNGSGSFNPAINFPAGDAPYRISAGRINSDNLPDIVIANLNGRVNVLINSGGTNFSNRTEYIPGVSQYQNYFSSLCLADMDNDNDIDVLYSSTGLYINNANIVFYTNQNGTLTSPQGINHGSLSGAAIDIEASDLNGDGWKDVITTSTNGTWTDGFRIIFSNGSGGFNPAVYYDAGQKTNDIMIGDADNDGLRDILTTDSYSMSVTMHKNLGNGIFPRPGLFTTGNSVAGSLDAADIDSDGDLDVVVSASGRAATGVTVKVLKNEGNANFGSGITYSIRGGGVQAKFRDLNNDNKPDLLFATAINSPPYDFHYAINNGNGTFGPVQTKSIGSCGWYDIDAADFDNDNDKDVVLTEWLGCPGIPNSGKRIFICLNQGNAVFLNPTIKVVGDEPGAIGIADFNRDGNLDIVTGVVGAKLEISLGLGNGDFMPPVPYSIGSQGGAADIVVADFNNDNKADIASCNFFENYWVSILKGNGDGTLQPAQNLPTAYSPDLLNVSGITCGDLDNDGDLDIIVSNNASRTLSLYYNTNGIFQYRMRAGGYNSVSSPFFGNFDNDGKGDIVAVGSLPPSGISSTLIFLKGNTALIGISNNTGTIPHTFIISQNYPNPFNPRTKVEFGIPKSTNVSIKVFDAIGRQVAILIDEFKQAGNYTVDFDAGNLASGVYYYQIEADDFVLAKKMVLIK